MIPGSGRSPGKGNGNPLHNSCLENSTDRGEWRVPVHGGRKESDTAEPRTLPPFVDLTWLRRALQYLLAATWGRARPSPRCRSVLPADLTAGLTAGILQGEWVSDRNCWTSRCLPIPEGLREKLGIEGSRWSTQFWTWGVHGPKG